MIVRRSAAIVCFLLVVVGGIALVVPILPGVTGAPACGNSITLSPVMRHAPYTVNGITSLCGILRGNRRHEVLPWVVLGLLGLATVGVLALSNRRTEWNEPTHV